MTETLLDNNNESKSYLAELVGEGKKFKDLEALAAGKLESDSYIKVLEKRVDDLRDDYLKQREESNSRARLEELIDQLSNKASSSTNTHTTPAKIETQPTQKPIDLDDLVDRKITEKEQARQMQANLQVVKGKLKERFGDNFAEVVTQRI